MTPPYPQTSLYPEFLRATNFFLKLPLGLIVTTVNSHVFGPRSKESELGDRTVSRGNEEGQIPGSAPSLALKGTSAKGRKHEREHIL